MFTMERKFRYFFTVCVIVGFQIHVPVTMLPASLELGSLSEPIEHAQDSVSVPPATRILNEKVIAAGPHTREFKSTINNVQTILDGSDEYKRARDVEYIPPREHHGEQEKYSTRISSYSGGHYQQNGSVNQARPQDHQSFNAIKDLNGLEVSLEIKHVKSPQSDFNRLSSDLVGVRLKQIEERLTNISSDIVAKRNGLANGDLRDAENKNINSDRDVNNEIHKTETNRKVTVNFGGKKSLKTDNKFVNGIFWSRDLENRYTKGYTDKDHLDWKRKVGSHYVVKMEEGCGSMQNRLVTFNDSTKACVRYRMNAELMQGDIYSYYLSKLLNMGYSPPVSMVVPRNSQQWRQVREDMDQAKWSEHKPSIVSRWVPELGPVYMSSELRDGKSQLRPENYWFGERPLDELCELVQWTDLVVFDYISANLDRVVNNLFNLKWNSKMLEKPIHNLMKVKSTGLFLYLDNESGLFHGYRLLESYAGYHKSQLESTCVFKRSTVDAIEKLHLSGNAGEELQNLYQNSEQNHGSLPRMSKKNMQMLQDRITDVYKHIQLCKYELSAMFTSR